MSDPLDKHSTALISRMADSTSPVAGNACADSIVDNIPCMVFQRKLHADGTISFPYANDAVLEFSGLDPAIVTTDPAAVSARIHPEDLEALQASVRRSFHDMAPHSEEFRYHHPALGWRWFQTISKPRKNGDGSIVADTLALDITDRKETEQELERNRMRLNDHLIELQDTKERLEQRTHELVKTVRDLAEARDEAETANRAKSDFLATMSHEIRTPMNGVLGMASLLKHSPLDETQREYIDTIEQSGEALLQIINDVLDYSKMEAGQFTLDKTVFSVLEVMDSAVQLVRPQCQEKSIILRTFAAPDVPDRMVGDSGRLRQILLNLLGNAAKFTQSGTITVECLEPTLVGRDVELRFAISDTGIGISADAQETLFEVFSQADASTTRRFGGTGLGLSICKRLCHLMDGDISVESAPGQGSTFHFAIKCKLIDGPPAEISAPRHMALPGRALLTAAIVEPDSGLDRQLQAYGIATEIFDDTGSLLDHLDATPGKTSLIVLDSESLTGPANPAARLKKQQRERPFALWIVGAAQPELAEFAKFLDIPVRQARLRQYIDGLSKGTSEVTTRPPERTSEKPEKPACAQPDPGTARLLEVLLVEDNKVNQRVATAILETAGMSVTLAKNGVEALDMVRRHDFDVVLMDIHMPEMDGVTATRKIREMPPPHCDLPIIAVTANAMKGDRETYLDAGMNDYVSKPIEPVALADAISRQVGVSGVSASPPAQQSEPKSEVAERTETPLSVLLVEDNKVNQRLATAILEAAGMSVAFAENGVEALDRLQEHDVDVILMDIHMPEMDGVTTARKIRELPPPHCDLPIIAVTANTMKRDRETYLEAGMNDYVPKPIDPVALVDAIGRQAGVSTGIGSTAAPGHELKTEPKEKSEETEKTDSRLSVLLVEDNKVNQRVAIAMLETAGMSVTLAENGLEALDRLQEHDVDVILMDIHMPEMDGVTATRKIRDLPPPHCNIPIIALTANAMKGDRETYLDAGMNDYVSKPVDPAALADAIGRQAGITTEIASTARRPKASNDTPQITADEVNALFEGLEDILD